MFNYVTVPYSVSGGAVNLNLTAHAQNLTEHVQYPAAHAQAAPLPDKEDMSLPPAYTDPEVQATDESAYVEIPSLPPPYSEQGFYGVDNPTYK